MHARWLRASLVGVLVVAGVARAQDGEEPLSDEVPADGSEVRPPEDARVPGPAVDHAGWTWQLFGPVRAGGVTDIGVHPRDPLRIALAADNGSVWWTTDGGEEWERILDPLFLIGEDTTDDEDRLFGAGNRLDELLSGVEEGLVPEDEYDATDLADQLEDQLDEVISQFSADADVDPWFVGEAGDPRQVRAVPRVWFTADGRLLVGRADGLWQTLDQGESWQRALDLPVLSAVQLPDGAWVVGTPDGLRYDDGDVWLEAVDGTRDLVVYGLAREGERVFAATSDGIWLAYAARYWVPLALAEQQVDAIAAGEDGTVWALSEGLLVASRDEGRSWADEDGAPVGARALTVVGPSHVVITGESGPWETLDGRTWQSLGLGLGRSPGEDLAVLDGVLLHASAEGLFQLLPHLAEEPQTRGEAFVPVDDLLAAVEARFAPLTRNFTPARRTLRAFAPELQLRFWYDHDWRLAYYDTSGTINSPDGAWRAEVRLKWTPSRRPSIATDSSVEAVDLIEAMVVDSEVFLTTPDNNSVLMNRLDRRSAVYQRDTSDSVTKMYFERQDLVARRSALANASLPDRVYHELRIHELEARLDALTEGTVSRWQASLD